MEVACCEEDLQGHFLIDDRAKHGADRFAGEHIRFGSDRFPDWQAVMAYLRTVDAEVESSQDPE